MPLEMNPEIRARWTAALRSGDYPQDDGNEPAGEPERVGLAELNDEYGWDFARIADAIDGGA